MKTSIILLILAGALIILSIPAPKPDIDFGLYTGTVTENAVPFGTYIAEGD